MKLKTGRTKEVVFTSRTSSTDGLSPAQWGRLLRRLTTSVYSPRSFGSVAAHASRREINCANVRRTQIAADKYPSLIDNRARRLAGNGAERANERTATIITPTA